METRKLGLLGCLGVFFGVLGACTVKTDDEDELDGAGGSGTEAMAGAGGQSAAGVAGNMAAGGATTEAASCDGLEPLPNTVDTDMTVGPGCVRVFQTGVAGPATLTIRPGTRVEMLAGGFLSVARNGDDAALVALGTEAEPIIFTSAAARPMPGDWECVRLGGGGSELDHVVVEYGGAPCGATGAGTEAMIQVADDIRGITNVTFQDSSSHGIFIERGAPRVFENNTFRRNADAGIHISAEKLTSLGKPNVFEDADDVILIEPNLATESGIWTNQGIPYRASAGFGVQGDVQLEAGVRLELGGGSMSVSKLDLLGTAEEPVIITSALSPARAGDWGCIDYGRASRIEHAIVEYGGSGEGCTGGSIRAALRLVAGTTISDSAFRNIDGAAVEALDCLDMAGWCANQFEAVAEGPLLCASTPTACP